MGLFKKRATTVVDLTALQKSGTLQRARAIKGDQETTRNEFVDLSSQSTSSTESSTPNLDFLSSIAKASAKESENSANSNDNSQHLKIKIEDLEYKIERLIERLEKVEDRLLKEE